MQDNIDCTQFGNPHGDEGREVLVGMNDRHRPLSEWGLSKLPQIHPKKILDIGCGGGMLISIMGEKYPDALIDGIDISEESMKLAGETNIEIIAQGRCALRIGSVTDLPFDDGAFDLVTAVETYFFWPDFVHDIGEAARVVSDSGYLLVVSEQYPHPDFKERNDGYARDFGMKLFENDRMLELIESHGFEVSVFTVEETNWVAFMGKRITSSS